MSEERQDRIGDLVRAHVPSVEFPGDEIRERVERSTRDGKTGGRSSEEAVVGIRAARAAEPQERAGSGASGRAWIRSGIGLVAALLLFFVGAEYGRRTTLATIARAPGPDAEPLAGGAGLPLSIQRAGSDYVARLAELSSGEEVLTEGEREMGREVAMTILYAAAVELMRDAGDDEVLATIAQLVDRRRGSDPVGGALRGVWF